ncbi:DMT family transporter [Amycolatopsis thermoflava]|uniref:DMT family transporter n=1 Tax=Amycolatopsis thermoflava TaxID=84480 RepID=UPI000688B6BB|nr:EamA family transporter [Amycolatopsis thermoflava]
MLPLYLGLSGFTLGRYGFRTECDCRRSAKIAVATVVAGALAIASRVSWPRSPRQWAHTAFVGVLLQAMQFVGVYVGLGNGVPAGMAALVVSASPLVIAAIAVPLFGENLRPIQWIGFALGLGGVAVAVSSGLRSDVPTAGLLAVFGGLAAFVAGTLYQKRFTTREIDVRAGITVQLLASTVVVTPLALVDGGLAIRVDLTVIWPLAWLSVVCSIGGFALLFAMLRRHSGGAATSALFLVPPVTGLVAVPVLGQPLSVSSAMGTALAAIGVALAVRSPSRRRQKSRSG